MRCLGPRTVQFLEAHPLNALLAHCISSGSHSPWRRAPLMCPLPTQHQPLHTPAHEASALFAAHTASSPSTTSAHPAPSPGTCRLSPHCTQPTPLRTWHLQVPRAWWCCSAWGWRLHRIKDINLWKVMFHGWTSVTGRLCFIDGFTTCQRWHVCTDSSQHHQQPCIQPPCKHSLHCAKDAQSHAIDVPQDARILCP